MRRQRRATRRRETLRLGGTASMSYIEAFEFGFDGHTLGMLLKHARLSGRRRVEE